MQIVAFLLYFENYCEVVILYVSCYTFDVGVVVCICGENGFCWRICVGAGLSPV